MESVGAPEEASSEEKVAEDVADGIEAEEGQNLSDAEDSGEVSLEKEVEDLRAQVEKEKKEYLFLMADFDNFRKRTLKEKSELIKNAGENVLKGLLPIMDDFERGIAASSKDEAAASAVEGMQLIYNKLVKFLEANGVKEMETNGQPFDSEFHEAIAQVPAQNEEQKGKVIDTVQKGYMINDKVLRHARVAVAQ
ncbi:MAG: nucleotide exchange factor GrpE [Bacteroides sp.]|nr:nucleotide exchange factor GrpE [Bacteroides sp.]